MKGKWNDAPAGLRTAGRAMKAAVYIVAIGTAAYWAAPSMAAMTPLDSAGFSNKTEMDDGGSLNATSDTTEWMKQGSGTDSLGGGFLNYATATTAGSNPHPVDYWRSNTFADPTVNSTTGFTVEIRAQMNDALDGTDGLDRALQLLGSAGGNYGLLYVGLDHVYWGGSASIIATGDNTDGYHVFRVTEDPATTTYNVWRDGVLIGNQLTGVSKSGFAAQLYFGDGTSAFNGSASVDYIRWTASPHSPVPEPALVALLGFGGLMLIRRRRRT